MLKLPPQYVAFPSAAIFRRYPLPPDLGETWRIVYALGWVNKYAFTPPASISELLAFHHNLKVRALEYRLERLERTGWLEVKRASGQSNIYKAIVPADEPQDYSTTPTERSGEPASVIQRFAGEDLARHDAMVKSAKETDTPATGCTSPISSSRGLDHNPIFEHNTTTTSIMSRAREILAAVNVRVGDLDLSGMSGERAEQIAVYVRDNPDKKRSPAGYVHAVLANNPSWKPPSQEKKTWYAEYDHLVIR